MRNLAIAFYLMSVRSLDLQLQVASPAISGKVAAAAAAADRALHQPHARRRRHPRGSHGGESGGQQAGTI